MRKIMLRADGGPAIGWGHVYRLLALVQMLYRDFDCSFVSDSNPEFLTTALRKINVPLINTKPVAYRSPEQRSTGDEVAFDMQDVLCGDEIVVLDGYWFGTSFQSAIKEKGCKLVYIDDLHDAATAADLLINPSWEITAAAYKAAPYTKFAFGAGYSLLRPAFLKAAQEELAGKKTKDIFVCFGGADPLDLTNRTLRVLQQFPFYSAIHCITGPSFSNTAGLQAAAGADSRIRNYQNLDETAMASIMKNGGFGIVPCSSVLLEAIACDVQCITCFYAHNQQGFHSIITSKGMLSAGWAGDDFEKELARCINEQAGGYSIPHPMRSIIAGSAQNFVEEFKILQQ